MIPRKVTDIVARQDQVPPRRDAGGGQSRPSSSSAAPGETVVLCIIQRAYAASVPQ
jgi:hypothetical protein